MGMLAVITAAVGAVGATAAAGAAVLAVAQSQTGSIDIYALIERGGLPMALFLALIEVGRRHDRAYKIIEAKDKTILEMSNRQTTAIETTNEIANDSMTMARDTHSTLKELVTLLRGRLGVG